MLLTWKSILQLILRILITLFVVATLSGQSAAASMAACEMHSTNNEAKTHSKHMQSEHHQMMSAEMDCCDPKSATQCNECTCPTHMCSTNLAAFSLNEWLALIALHSDKLNFVSGQLSTYPQSLYKPPIIA
ncbi:hypothetical protein EAG18_13065 [Pseudoalteromonas sp. J010]|nr:hypothetical protein EAG18_13065 [Pseudoalteromonas sp. J010]